MTTWWHPMVRATARRRLAAERAAALRRVDAWQPPLGTGLWRTAYGESCDAVLAYDRIVALVPAGPVRDELAGRRPDLLAMLDRVRYLAENGAALDPAGPVRDAELLALLAEDPHGDLGQQLGAPPSHLLMDALAAVRGAMWRATEEAARLAVHLQENAGATDTAIWLTALAAGVVSARRADWAP
ncbi:MAG TPA: hypothetical protein VFE14_05940 [Micromonosporaceae bacterium]|jgi:hypothetical protein|nr:hypothetical protein [Micromonosporaceae bacterium]